MADTNRRYSYTMLYVVLLICVLSLGVHGAPTGEHIVVNIDWDEQNTNVADCFNGLECSLRSAWYACQSLAAYTPCIINVTAIPILFIDPTIGPLYLTGGSDFTLQADTLTSVISNGTASVDYLSNFITYSEAIDAPSGDYPYLNISNLAFVGFGRPDVDGGVLSMLGHVYMHLENIAFVNNTGRYGGSIYLDSSAAGITINSCLFDGNNADSGGAVAINNYNQYISITNCVMINNGGSYLGGSIYVGYYNSHITLADSQLLFNTGPYGGGLMAFQYNDDIQVLNTTFADNFASAAGGGIYFYNDNTNVLIADSRFERCQSVSGGGLYMYDANLNIDITNTTFVECIATYDNGGGMYLHSQSNDVLIAGCAFSYCNASYHGGGVFIATENTGVSIEGTTFEHCYASGGGGIYVEALNPAMTLSHLQVSDCSAVAGGGLYVSRNNFNMLVEHSVFSNCFGLYRGGAMYSDFSNDYMVITSTNITDSTSEYGGGLFLSRNHYTTVAYCVIQGCTGSVAGGGVFLYAENDVIVFVDTKFDTNHGYIGGALASYPATQGVVIAGCTIVSNHAEADGGGVALSGGNEHFIMTDSETAFHLHVLETEHPYANTAAGGNGVIWSQTIEDVDAFAFIIHFDARSSLNNADDFYIIDENGDTALYVGGDGYWPGKQLAPLRVYGSRFTIFLVGYSDLTRPATVKLDDLYGVKMFVAPMLIQPGKPTLFALNTANGRGGGMHMSFHINFAVLTNVNFLYNHAGASGGGLSMHSAATGIVMAHLLFEENTCDDEGAAIDIESGAGGIYASNCVFHFNHALQDGGALAFVVSNGRSNLVLAGTSSAVYFQQCVFTANTAQRGGAVFIDRDNDINILSCVNTGNTATASGGGLHVEAQNTLYTYETVIQNNSAGTYGGGVATGADNLVYLSSASLLHNSAGSDGGGLSVHGDTTIALEGHSLISGNRATVVGGGAASFDASVWYVFDDASATIERNTAQRGSALYFRGVPERPSDSILLNLRIVSNVATVGGTVYWLQDEVMTTEPIGVQDPSNTWANNTAPYGVRVATQAVRINGDGSYHVSTYGTALWPPLNFALQDAYGQVMPLDGPTRLLASLINTSSSQCHGRIPVLSGTQIQQVNRSASFAALLVSCAPQGSIKLNFEAQLLDLEEVTDISDLASYSVLKQVHVQFRSCRRGEYIKDGQCVVCATGSYSLEYPVTADTTCKDCTGKSGVVNCGGDVIEVGSGYWRRYNTSDSVLDCLTDSNGCHGGVSTGDALCDLGYIGPLCAVCAEGYYDSAGVCEVCGETPLLSPAVVVFLGFAALMVLIATFFFYAKCIDKASPAASTETASMAKLIGEDGVLEAEAGTVDGMIPAAILDGDDNSSDDSTVVAYGKAAKMWLRKRFKQVRSQLKIVITTYQIVSSIPSNLSVSFPPEFTALLKAFSVFNLNVTAVVPFSCSQRFTFIDKLVFTTLFPIILACLLLVICIADILYQFRKYAATDPVRKQKIDGVKDQYLTYFFFLSYFVLPSVSTTIFQTFLCTNVDPHGEDSDTSDSFLTADMSVSCTSAYYQRGVAYAVVMLLVYVVGIPALYLAMLIRNKEEIERREEVETTKEVGTQTNDDLAEESPAWLHGSHWHNAADAHEHHKTMSSRAQRLAFLWDAYEPQFWYWEVVETTRRLMLTAVLSVCGTGTSAQSILAVLLGVVYIKLYGFYAPYERDEDDVVAEVGQFQIFFTFLGALIRQKSLLGAQYDDAVSGSLIFINAAVTLLFLYFGVRVVREDIAHSREEYQRQEQMPSRHYFKEPPAYMMEKSTPASTESYYYGEMEMSDFDTYTNSGQDERKEAEFSQGRGLDNHTGYGNSAGAVDCAPAESFLPRVPAAIVVDDHAQD